MTKCRSRKKEIAQDVIKKILACTDARFLRAATDKDKRRLGIPFHKKAWCFVDEYSILEKAKQGLRQKKEWKDDSSGDEYGDHSDVASLQSFDTGSSLQTSDTGSVNTQYHQDTTNCSQVQSSFDDVANSDLWEEDFSEKPLDWSNLPSSEMLFGRELLDQILAES